MAPGIGGGFVGRIRDVLTRRERQRVEDESASPAAVLVPLFIENDGLHVLFTKRTDTLPHHRGQIAFPGGRHDPEEDDSLLVTATREAQEEIGLRPEHAAILGPLDDCHTIRTGFVISPFVALIPHPYDFRPSPIEVAEIFSVPLALLSDPARRQEELWEFGEVRVPITTLRYQGHVIWGATERISQNLVDVLATLDDDTDAS
jgi:8-oxo-dGTP pyrophosphatase MutT (NUDIX family)